MRSVVALLVAAALAFLPRSPAAGSSAPTADALNTPVTPSALVGDPPELDASFGTGGKVLTEMGGSRAFAIALQSDGKLVVVGEGNGAFAVARYTTTGALDSTFDGDGKATIDVGYFDDALDVAIQSDGKIVVVGTNSPGGFCCEAAIVRLTTTGAPDPTFDSDGIVTIGFGGTLFGASSVAIQSDGKILVGGVGAPFGGSVFTVARLTTAGILDSTFGTGGYAGASMGVDSTVADLAIQGDGKIVAVGGSGGDFGIIRYTTGGSLDSTFDGDGKTTTDFGQSDGAESVALQADGKIVVAGTGNSKFAVARYTGSGALDTAFDGDGKSTAGVLGKGIESAADVAIQAGGKIVAVGRAFDDFDSEYGVLRFDTDGWLDGRMITTFADPADDWAQGIAIQADGKIVVVGGLTGCSSACSWTMARYSGVTPIRTLAASPSTADFGAVTVGDAPAQAIVSITNTGSVPLELDLVETTGTADGMSVSSETCTGAPLLARASCSVELAWAPQAAGTLSAELHVNSDADVTPLIVPLQGHAVLPPSGIGWGTTSNAGPAHTWNSSGALGRTVQSGTQRLHLAYATNRINGKWAKDSGPHAGIYYVRGSSGSSWSTPKRLNPSSQHAVRLGLAAAGSRVYVTWASQTKISKYVPRAPRVLYVRVNTNHGASTAWKRTVRLTSMHGRVDFPTVAAAGDDVYVAWTNAKTGDVRVAASHDRGKTWHTATVGTTVASSSSGKEGFPSIAASGATVVVSWLADNHGAVKARLSTDRAGVWGTTTAVGGASNGSVTTAASGSRVAVAWTTADDVVVRQANGGSWQDAQVISSLQPATSPAPYSAQVVLQGTTRIGVAWAAQTNDSGSRSDLRWMESVDDGSHWYAEETVGSGASSSSRRLNDWPSVVWPEAGTRYVAWNGWTAGTSSYRQYLRRGSGAPIGPSFAPAAWSPQPRFASDASQASRSSGLGVRRGRFGGLSPMGW